MMVAFLSCLFAASQCYAQKNNGGNKVATLQDSIDVYNNARAVQDFYERSGQYKKTHETRLNTDDPAAIHASNDRKYNSVLRTIKDERLTTHGRRRITPGEYRITLDKYRYKQRELSDYVLNTDAPMQLFDRRIAPQLLVDYTFTGDPNSPVNNDDVDFKMYDPIAVKPYSKLTAEEKALRNAKYPQVLQKKQPPPKEKSVQTKNAPKVAKEPGGSVFIISGAVADSVRFKRFKSRKEAEDYIRKLKTNTEPEEK